MTWDWVGPPRDVRPLFPVERSALLGLLTELTAAEWEAATCCPGWRVRDIVAHLVHDYGRRLSGTRDAYAGPGFGAGEDLPRYLARVNQEFVAAAAGLSPRVLTELIGCLGPRLDLLWDGLDLDEIGVDVWWVEPDTGAPRWLDVGREYTEFWVHQQQIRAAVGRPGADAPELVAAVVDIVVRGLPRTLARYAPAPDAAGAAVRVGVTGAAPAEWLAERRPDGRWWLRPVPAGPAARTGDADVRVDAGVLWRLAARMISPYEAARHARVTGDERLGRAALRLLSIIR